jgi:hypothetical protein
VSKLAKRLNSAANAVGASHHQVELVRRGPKTYFVTCSQSPRFNWNVCLSHRDVGRNLDFFAPGHIGMDRKSTTYSVYFIEKGSFEELTGESVLLHYLQECEVRKEFERFNHVREKLFNATMEQLELAYRFKCLVIAPGIIESVPPVMARSTPPSTTWWEDHCFFVNGFLLPDILLQSEFAFCGFDTKYEQYWALIQSTFQFMIKYKRNEYWHSSTETGSAFWKSMEILSRRIRTTCAQTLEEAEYNRFFDEITNEFAALAQCVEASKTATSPSPNVSSGYTPPTRLQLTARRCAYRLWTIKTTASLYVLERHKLRKMLPRHEIGCPVSGEKSAFQWFL